MKAEGQCYNYRPDASNSNKMIGVCDYYNVIGGIQGGCRFRGSGLQSVSKLKKCPNPMDIIYDNSFIIDKPCISCEVPKLNNGACCLDETNCNDINKWNNLCGNYLKDVKKKECERILKRFEIIANSADGFIGMTDTPSVFSWRIHKLIDSIRNGGLK
jgi:hypothetical protein